MKPTQLPYYLRTSILFLIPVRIKINQFSTSKKSLNLSHLFFLNIIISFFFFFLPSQIFGQENDQTLDRLSKDILLLIQKNLRNKNTVNFSGQDLSLVDSLLNLNDTALELLNKLPLLDKRKALLRKDLGINFKSQYWLNYNPSIEDDGNPDAYDGSRLRMGLEWDLLKGGYFGNKNKIKQLEEEEHIELVKNNFRRNKERLYFRYNFLIYIFNEAKIQLLLKRKEQLNEEIDLLHKVYFLKGILYDYIIKRKSRLEQINIKIANYEKYNEWFDQTLNLFDPAESFDIQQLPILEIDLDFLANGNGTEPLLQSMFQKKQNLENLKNKPVNDLSLRFLAYHNFRFADTGLENKDFSSLGLSLSVPTEMIFNQKEERALIAQQLKREMDIKQHEQFNDFSELINYHYEYQYKLEHYMEFIHKEMLYHERIRMETVEQKDYTDIFRSLKILDYIDTQREVQLEMIDLKQQMYLLLLKIYGKTSYDSALPFIKQVDIANFYQRLPAQRILMLDANNLEKYEVNFLKNYLLSNGIEEVILNATKNISPETFKDFKFALNENNIRVLESISSTNKLQTPQTNKIFDGFVQDYQDLYLEHFDTTAIKRNASFSMLKLSDHFSLERLESLTNKGHRLILNLSPNALMTLEQHFREMRLSNTTLSVYVDANEFQSRIALEIYIQQLTEVYKIKSVVINDFEKLLFLDTEILVKKE